MNENESRCLFVCSIMRFTFAKNCIRFASSFLLQKFANNVSNCRDGGVVMSKKRDSSTRIEHTGNFGCGSQLFETPTILKSAL